MNNKDFIHLEELPDSIGHELTIKAKAMMKQIDALEPPYAVTALIGLVANYIYNTYQPMAFNRILLAFQDSVIASLEAWQAEDSGKLGRL